ncbi:MAG TPA: hypothetical protein PKK18_07525 [Chitinophagales bacterium]|nr:hypothetical protein [Chitinophagales bacterium]HNF19998.1 hypothetical protein [Chitinophagales bacterium]HNF52307.1 hypothetical protein [Chitinophagales bacterium]HNG71605.1 hypothetical protein [Chitinophagales bacterium]HNJ02341.1 hypothetical protein [Chitinophagales bacterium]
MNKADIKIKFPYLQRMLDKARSMFKIDMQKLRSADSSHLFWMDMTMLIIVIINLLYLFFGFLFQFNAIASGIHYVLPRFHDWYAENVFEHVFHYDLIFVGIYIAELLYRWIRSIYRKKYDKWWFYPFVHWYDVIMCIPIIKGFNFFAVVRLFGLVYRLQRLGVFDLTKTYVFKKSAFVSDVVVEEVADRVIAKMISMAQEEVQKGSPLMEKIVSNVVKPKEAEIVDYLSDRVGQAINISYTQYRSELQEYLFKKLKAAIHENQELKTLNYIPGIGNFIKETLDRAVADITFNTIDKIMLDIIAPDNTRGVKELTHGIIESFLDRSHPANQDLNQIIVGIVHDSLEEIKQSVLMKEWKIEQAKVKKAKIEEEIRESQNI